MMTLTSNRRFGVEIECFGITREQAVQAITRAGISCRIEDYGHSVPSSWKIVPDGSVSNGFEVVSPPLSGQDGLDQVTKVSEALAGAGAKVDRRCGLHVHVDAQGLTGMDVVNIIQRYSTNEREIDGWMPESRRANNNNFCRAMAGLMSYIPSHSASTTVGTIVQGLRGYDRYWKVNLLAYLRHGTVEFRQHSGTVQAKKMVPWIIFCVNFVETSRVQPVVTPRSGRAPRLSVVQQKMHKLAELLTNSSRFNTVTPALIARVLDVSEKNAVNYVSKFRAHYQVQIKVRRGYGYYVTNATDMNARIALVDNNSTVAVAPSVQPAVPTFATTLFSGLSPEVVNYFQERTMELGRN